MNRDEAYQAMLNGEKITHKYFTPDEYIHIVDGCIVNENGRYPGYDFSMLVSWLTGSQFIKVTRNEIHNRVERKQNRRDYPER